jgi:hypothetical protein
MSIRSAWQSAKKQFSEMPYYQKHILTGSIGIVTMSLGTVIGVALQDAVCSIGCPIMIAESIRHLRVGYRGLQARKYALG